MQLLLGFQGDQLCAFCLGEQILLDEEVNVLEETVGEHEKCGLFDKEELKLLVELIVDLFELSVKDLDALRRYDVITHECVWQIGHKLEDTLWMQQDINNFLLRDVSEEFFGFGVDFDMRDEGSGGELIVEVED